MTGTPLELAASAVQKTMESWNIIDKTAESFVPRFEINEITLGRVLGRGGFCVVNEISSVTLKDNSSPTCASDGFRTAPKRSSSSKKYSKSTFEENDALENDQETFRSGHVTQDRTFISEKCIRKGKARYAIKMVSGETRKDKSRFVKGVMDLAIEFKILAVLKHPNIIKMRGACVGDIFQEKNYILLDRLYDTLALRLSNWNKKDSNVFYRLQKKKQKKLLDERIIVAHDLASAFNYLHSHNIIYRDLKPDNIGFDVRGDVKLFDFGLAKEIEGGMEDEVFELSGETGSLRYMAPEVCKNTPYNLKADVYSFGILLWQIISLRTPFSGYNVRMHYKVVITDGGRPKLDDKWSLGLRVLMSNCWSADISLRPKFDEIVKILFDETDDEEAYALDCSNRTDRSKNST